MKPGDPQASLMASQCAALVGVRSQLFHCASQLWVFGEIEKWKILPGKLVFVESCEMWRYFTRSTRSLLRIASCFHADRKSDPTEWHQIGACPASLVPRQRNIAYR
jgi:hypothetical protein